MAKVLDLTIYTIRNQGAEDQKQLAKYREAEAKRIQAATQPCPRRDQWSNRSPIVSAACSAELVQRIVTTPVLDGTQAGHPDFEELVMNENPYLEKREDFLGYGPVEVMGRLPTSVAPGPGTKR